MAVYNCAESKATAHIVQAWSPPEGSESHGFSLTSYKSFFFFFFLMSPAIYFLLL